MPIPALRPRWPLASSLALTLALPLASRPALAAPPEDETGDNSEDEGSTETPEPAEPTATDEGEGGADLQPEVTAVEPAEVPSGGGVAGAIVDPNDPNATRAQSDLEGESLDTEVEGVPERLPKLQIAGWWTTFAAVALATTGGIFAGVAETRQDDAERLAYGFDLETGRAILYGSVAEDYERLLSEGETYQWVARGFVIAGGVTLLVSVALFAADGARRRKAEHAEEARLQLEPGPSGLRLRF